METIAAHTTPFWRSNSSQLMSLYSQGQRVQVTKLLISSVQLQLPHLQLSSPGTALEAFLPRLQGIGQDARPQRDGVVLDTIRPDEGWQELLRSGRLAGLQGQACQGQSLSHTGAASSASSRPPVSKALPSAPPWSNPKQWQASEG